MAISTHETHQLYNTLADVRKLKHQYVHRPTKGQRQDIADKRLGVIDEINLVKVMVIEKAIKKHSMRSHQVSDSELSS
jgi:hypothetical protein